MGLMGGLQLLLQFLTRVFQFSRLLDKSRTVTRSCRISCCFSAERRFHTANVLMIPLLVTPLTPELLRQALETVRGQDVEQWLEEHLGLPPQKKKRVVLTAAGRRNAKEDPEPA